MNVVDCIKCGKTVDSDLRPYVCTCGMVYSVSGKWIAPLGNLGRNEKRHAARLRKAQSDIAGREAWRILHEKPIGNSEWFAEWKKSIPKGCGCSQSFDDMLAKLPPDFSSKEGWFEWTVAIHNRVNAKLNKPQLCLEKAAMLWRSDPLYALHSPWAYGGMELWSISLASKLPCFGFVSHLESEATDKHLRSCLRSVAVDRTIDQVSSAGLPLLVSNVHSFRKHKNSVAIGVAHGVCDYTRKNIVSGQYDHLVAVSDLVSQRVKAWTGRTVISIPNGVDIDRLKPVVTRDEFRLRHSIPDSARVVAIVGRLNDEKGVSKLLNALACLSEDWLGLFVGWGNLKAIQQQMNERGLTHRCRIAHAVENVGDVYNAVDCVASLADAEGYCLTAMEAMYFGLPLVSTATGIVADLLEKHGGFGPAIVESNASPQDVASAIETARPVTIDLSDHTSDAMADRWREFLSRF